MDDPKFLRALCTLDVDILDEYDDYLVSIVLPFISRCALCSYNDHSASSPWNLKRQRLVKLLLKFPEVNTLVELLSTDFNEVASDCHDQLLLR